MNARRIRRVIGPVVVAAMVISACSALEPPQTLALAETDVEPAVIRVVAADPAGLVEPLGEWDRNHPTVSVELTILGVDELHTVALVDPSQTNDDEDQPLAETIEVPDVVVFDASWAPTARTNAMSFLDLNQFGADAWQQQSIEWRWNSGDAGDALIAVPIDAGGLALAWRDDLVGSELGTDLVEIDSWCSLIDAGDRYADASGNAFLPEVSSLFTSVVEQSELAFFDDDQKALIHETDPVIRHAWDLSMRALGEDAMFTDPCPELDDVQRIASTIVPGSADWAAAVVNGLMAAQLVSSHELASLEAESPADARWRASAVPGVVAPERGRSLAIRADTSSPAIAWDLVATLLAPSTQGRMHDATGRTPAAASLLEPGALGDPTGPLGPELTAILASSVRARSSTIADVESVLILSEFAAAVERVAAGSQTPRDSWDEAVWRIAQKLS